MTVNAVSLSELRRTLGNKGEHWVRNVLLVTFAISSGVGSAESQGMCCTIESVLFRVTADIPLNFLISFHQPEESLSFSCLTPES